MRFLRQSLTGVFLAALTLALLIYAAHLIGSAIQARMSDERAPPRGGERVFAVNVRTATAETVTPVLQAFGQIESRRALELRAATGGRIVELAEAFEEGGAVSEGDLLLQIDPAPAQSVLARVESDLLDAEAEARDSERALTLARDELAAAGDQAELRERAARRQRDLQDRAVGTAAAVETAELAAAAARQAVLSRRQAVAQAQARLDQAATRIARAEIALDEARRDLAETRLTAGFDGTLSDVTLVEGRLVAVNEKLAMLIDPRALDVAFRVSTAQYARLLDANGALIPAPVTVALNAAGADLQAHGRISRDSAAVGADQSGRLIFAALDSAPGFKPGDFVTVAVDEPPLERAVRLPAAALGADRTVLVLGADDRLEAVEVTLLRRQGDDVLVRADALEGREVVLGRTPLLGAGIKVRPLRPEASLADDEIMLELSDERRVRLKALVEGNRQMPEDAKTRVLALLSEPQVSAQLVRRIEARQGG